MSDWQLIILSVVVSALVAIPSGYFGSVLFYKYQKRQTQKEIMPKVSVSHTKRDRVIYGQIINTGQEDIEQFKVELRWQQGKEENTRMAYRFFKAEENSQFVSGERIEYLKRDQEVKVAGIPQVADDNIIRVLVQGVGIHSRRPLEVVGEIKIPSQPKLYT